MPERHLDTTSFLAGCGVALVTPFGSDERLDEEALARLVEHVVGGGVDFVVALGTTGEAVSQTPEECRHVLRRIHDLVDGRVPLVAGPFGGNSTRGVAERMRAYREVLELPGYRALMSSVPSYVKPSQAGMRAHFLALADASPLPMLLYNVPSRTGCNMSAATTLELAAASDRFCGVKEASGDLAQGMALLRERPRGFAVLSGDDPTALPLMACGADGVVSVVANAYPKTWVAMTRAALAGKRSAAKRANDILLPLHRYLYCDGNPAGIKAVLAQLGLCDDRVRLPLAAVSEATDEAIAREVLRIAAEVAPAWA